MCKKVHFFERSEMDFYLDQYFNLLLVQLQNAHKRLLRNLYVSDLAHTLLAFLLLLEKLLLTGDIAAVALREDILSHGSHRLTGNDLTTHSSLDRDLE